MQKAVKNVSLKCNLHEMKDVSGLWVTREERGLEGEFPAEATNWKEGLCRKGWENRFGYQYRKVPRRVSVSSTKDNSRSHSFREEKESRDLPWGNWWTLADIKRSSGSPQVQHPGQPLLSVPPHHLNKVSTPMVFPVGFAIPFFPSPYSCASKSFGMTGGQGVQIIQL